MTINTPNRYKIDWNKLKESFFPEWGSLNITEISVTPKKIYTFNIISIKIPTSLYGVIKIK